ncbi:hypothetical protein VKT23_011047 [Stygiomarasmius scandens]|uniref:Uncharacterized protein n=1 Tax=Marasmiellus scandens TaxID=2682957 RepID=A0ABR1JFD1_9AGAR
MAGHGFPSSSNFLTCDVVGVPVSPMEVFGDAIGYKVDPWRRDEKSRRERESCMSDQGRVQGLRPAVIVNRVTDPATGQKLYKVNLFASFSNTPFDHLHSNTKDLVIFVANSNSRLPDGAQVIRTIPPWPRNIQYVMTRSVWTSNVTVWPCEAGSHYQISLEDRKLLESIGRQQDWALSVKLSQYEGGKKQWLADIRSAIASVRGKGSERDTSSRPKTLVKKALSTRTFASITPICQAMASTSITDKGRKDSEDGSSSIVSVSVLKAFYIKSPNDILFSAKESHLGRRETYVSDIPPGVNHIPSFIYNWTAGSACADIHSFDLLCAV